MEIPSTRELEPLILSLIRDRDTAGTPINFEAHVRSSREGSPEKVGGYSLLKKHSWMYRAEILVPMYCTGWLTVLASRRA